MYTAADHEGESVPMNTGELIGPGTLLVARPELVDANFRRTVVYVVGHGEDGTWGVILNRPSETPVHNVLPQWAPLTAKSQVIFMGGPVQPTAAMSLARCVRGVSPANREGMAQVAGQVGLLDLDSDPDDQKDALNGIRIFAGHAGWGEGQLESEIDEGMWDLVAGLPDDVLAGPRTDLWFQVLRRQPFPLTWQAYHPGELLRN